MRWLFYPAAIAIGIVVFAPILIVAATLAIVGGGLHSGGHAICDWIIDLARHAETWTKKGDAL